MDRRKHIAETRTNEFNAHQYFHPIGCWCKELRFNDERRKHDMLEEADSHICFDDPYTRTLRILITMMERRIK